MGLFHPNYNAPGPGVRKDEPRKKGAARFFEILGRDMGDLFRANVLCAICFVPALALIFLGILGRAVLLSAVGGLLGGFLLGPCYAGLHDTILRALRDEPGYWWHTYRRVWKRSFRSSLLPGIAFTALWSCLLYAWLAAAPAGPLLLSAVCLTACSLYFWLQSALFENSSAQKLENCLRMAVGFLPRTLAAVAVQLLYLFILPRLGFFGLLTGLWLPSLLAIMLVYPPLEHTLDLEAKIRQIQANR